MFSRLQTFKTGHSLISGGSNAAAVEISSWKWWLADFFYVSEQVSLTRPIYMEKCILILKSVDLIVRADLISSGLNSEDCLNFKWS